MEEKKWLKQRQDEWRERKIIQKGNGDRSFEIKAANIPANGNMKNKKLMKVQEVNKSRGKRRRKKLCRKKYSRARKK